MTIKEPVRNIVNQSSLPPYYPTQRHEPEFWENLGRTVATFGFLEEVLAKAIFAFTATTEYDESESEEKFSQWFSKLERSISDPLGSLIDTYGRSVRDNSKSTVNNLNELLDDLRKASTIRNVLCHGSWQVPNEDGASVPLFVNNRKEIFETPIDIRYLNQVQKAVVGLICAVIDTVTHMGYQFPGSNGIGETIL